MYEILFYNFGTVKSGFETIEDALEHLKRVCFEGGVYNSEDELEVSWSPINGIIWYSSDK